MSTPPTYAFGQSTPVRFFIDRAFQKCGIDPSNVSALQLQAALDHFNLMLSHWVNLGIPLFTVAQGMTQIIPGQNNYDLPSEIVDVLDMTSASVSAYYGGSGGGGAAFGSETGINYENIFNADPQSVGCVQTSPNGFVGYDYSQTVLQAFPVYYVGVCSLSSHPYQYTLLLESSQDNVVWTQAVQTPKRVYLPNNQTLSNTSLYNIFWFVNPNPKSAPYWRLREVGGATLALSQVYFAAPISSRLMTRMSRSEWAAISNKISYIGNSPSPPVSASYTSPSTGNMSSYYVDRNANPPLVVWPTPQMTGAVDVSTSSPTPQLALVYNYSLSYQDIAALSSPLLIPQRFYKAVIDGLSVELSVDFAPDKFQLLQMIAKESFAQASREDRERVPTRLIPTWSGF